MLHLALAALLLPDACADQALSGVEGGSTVLVSAPLPCATSQELPALSGTEPPRPASRCAILLDVDLSGHPSAVEVTCEEPALAPVVEDYLPRWRFAETRPAEGRETVRLALTLKSALSSDGTAWQVTDERGTILWNGEPEAAEHCDGSDEADTPVVHWSEVQVKKRVTPHYPAAAEDEGIEGVAVVRFFVNERGKPYVVKLESCPDIFRESALEAAWKWRFKPMEVDGKRVKAQFVLRIVYKLK
jgi:TonB family protein